MITKMISTEDLFRHVESNHLYFHQSNPHIPLCLGSFDYGFEEVFLCDETGCDIFDTDKGPTQVYIRAGPKSQGMPLFTDAAHSSQPPLGQNLVGCNQERVTVADLGALLSQSSTCLDVRILSSAVVGDQSMDDCFPGLLDTLKMHFPGAMTRIPLLRKLSQVSPKLFVSNGKKLRVHVCYKLTQGTPMPPGYAVCQNSLSDQGHWSLFPVDTQQPVLLLENSTLALALPVLQLPWALCCFVLRVSQEPKVGNPSEPIHPSDSFHLAILLHEQFHTLPENSLGLAVGMQNLLKEMCYPDFHVLSPDVRSCVWSLLDALRSTDADSDLLEHLRNQSFSLWAQT